MALYKSVTCIRLLSLWTELSLLWPPWLAIGGHYVLLFKVFYFFFFSFFLLIADVTKLPVSPAAKRRYTADMPLREGPRA